MRWVTLTVLNLPVEVLKLLTTETVTSSEEHIDLDAFAGLRGKRQQRQYSRESIAYQATFLDRLVNSTQPESRIRLRAN